MLYVNYILINLEKIKLQWQQNKEIKSLEIFFCSNWLKMHGIFWLFLFESVEIWDALNNLFVQSLNESSQTGNMNSQVPK